MLTLIITADGETQNIFEKHQQIIDATKIYEKEVNVIFLAHTNFKQLQELKEIVVSNKNHRLFVCDHKTSNEEMIAMGLHLAEDDDVLLCTLKTQAELIPQFLARRAEGYKIVRVRKKTKAFSQFFRVIGNWSYNIGLKVLGKHSDNFAEAEVMYLDSNIAQAVRNDLTKTRETRICNTFAQTKHMTIESRNIFEDEPKIAKQEKTMFNYGMWSLVMLLIFIALTSIYPFFHNYTYSWWMALIIIVWVGICVLLTFLCAKKVLYKRISPPNRVTQTGDALFGFNYYCKTGDELTKPLPKLEKPIIKNKIKIK